mgnify:CR=1 FL=1
MDEIIEEILNYAIKKTEGFSFCDQSFIFTELSEGLTRLSHDALNAEYGLKEDDFESHVTMHVFKSF